MFHNSGINGYRLRTDLRLGTAWKKNPPMSASLGSEYFAAALSATALCTDPAGNGPGSIMFSAHGAAWSTRTCNGSSVKLLTTLHSLPSTLTVSMHSGNPKHFLMRLLLLRGGVRMMLRSTGVLDPYWSRNAASFTSSEQSTT